MSETPAGCRLCRGPEGDKELDRVQVWEDRLWRLTTSRGGEIAGFSYLEPKRHVPHITDLAGEEAATLGPVLAKVTRALKEATESQLVYIYVFGGGIPHLHLHLGPHHDGDALNPMMIRGEVVATKLPSGATSIVSKEFPELPESRHAEARERFRSTLAGSPVPACDALLPLRPISESGLALPGQESSPCKPDWRLPARTLSLASPSAEFP
ncbi:MAG: hypothetical protein WAN87_08845 [Thermoplasmata archaeon]